MPLNLEAYGGYVANPSITYTLTNGSTADATQVMQNFNDIINALTDATKSLTIDALTCGGTATFNGSVTLGNGTPDDITITGSLASSIPIKTNNSYDIGSSTLGLASIYFGAPSSRTTRVLANQSLAASITLTLPGTDGDSGDYMESDGSGNLSFVPPRRGPDTLTNYGLTATVSSNALTVSMVGADGNSISSSNVVHVVARNATATTGTPTVNTITSAPTACVVPNTATLGHVSAQDQYVHVYVIFGTSTEIALSGQRVFDENKLQSATAITTGADDGLTLYATSNHTDKPIRYLGRIKSNQSAAGTWASSPTEIALPHGASPATSRNEIWVTGNNGHGGSSSGETMVRNFQTVQRSWGSAITRTARTTTAGDKFTINEDGVYSMLYVDSYSSSFQIGISINSAELTTEIQSITLTSILGIGSAGANLPCIVTVTANLLAGDVIRAHDQGVTTSSSAQFRITKLPD